MRVTRAATVTAMMAMKMRLTTTAAAIIVLEETDEGVGVVMDVEGDSGGLVEVVHVSLAKRIQRNCEISNICSTLAKD